MKRLTITFAEDIYLIGISEERNFKETDKIQIICKYHSFYNKIGLNISQFLQCRCLQNFKNKLKTTLWKKTTEQQSRLHPKTEDPDSKNACIIENNKLIEKTTTEIHKQNTY